MEMQQNLSLGEGVYPDDDHLLEDLAVCVGGATASLALREDFYARARLVWSERLLSCGSKGALGAVTE
ncbi:hypothetical protein PF005_g7780 [Phytophthora fragariae]|uniref:Uncharacterized protein n=1 Tax=Phytophthora fragariae TaxID=53985 RepID=A0A6A3F8K5_9STRA|nr:hypothetical protein PF003_g1038 [Phytophthora fragariae]KAE8941642.1 hypothetical protein PF009_g8584 [Phytophthora fragariae]KAE9019464.1 hypothetical protein PF011_g5814 [Phytophthora fragariae]KAE9096741.1 hypothetical protein PF010_g16230 [Phytophthora fragariae]KAE9120775.1 hypothetical protein PF007_g8049 [Phytophthora fragariae]